MINLKRRRPGAMIPMASMSDIGFLLLIFIMLVSLINQRHEVKIEYSEASLVEKTQVEDNLEIWVEVDGAITVDGVRMDAKTLEGYVADAIAKEPTTRVHVIADRRTPYRHVNTVVRTLQTLQHRSVSFVVREAL